VYVATAPTLYSPFDAYLFAVYPNGTQYWRSPFSTAITRPVTQNNIVFVASPRVATGDATTLYAINADGSSKWTLTLPAETPDFALTPTHVSVGPNGVVYVLVNGLYLFAVTPAGKLAWTFTSDVPDVSPPTLMNVSLPATSGDGSTVCVSTSFNSANGGNPIYDDDVVALDSSTGATEWTWSMNIENTKLSNLSAPMVSPVDGSVIVSALEYSGNGITILDVLDYSRNKGPYGIGPSNPASIAPILAPTGEVFVQTNSGLVGTNFSSLPWTFPVDLQGGAPLPICAGNDGSAYFVDAGDDLYAVSQKGSQLWENPAGTGASVLGYNFLTMGPDGILYAQGWTPATTNAPAGTTDICAIDPATGNRKWRYQTDAGFNGVFAFANNDTIYFGTTFGKLVAVKWTPAPVAP
jgi:hypothetical protein